MPLDKIAFYGAGWQILAEKLAAYLAGHDDGEAEARWDELVPPIRTWQPTSASTRARPYRCGVDNEQAFPVIRQTVLDTTDPRRLAEFYRQLFGLRYRPGRRAARPLASRTRAGQDWLILTSPAGGVTLAFQKVGELPGATWPDGPVPQQLHLDATVPTMADLDVQHERALRARRPAARGPLG